MHSESPVSSMLTFSPFQDIYYSVNSFVRHAETCYVVHISVSKTHSNTYPLRNVRYALLFLVYPDVAWGIHFSFWPALTQRAVIRVFSGLPLSFAQCSTWSLAYLDPACRISRRSSRPNLTCRIHPVSTGLPWHCVSYSRLFLTCIFLACRIPCSSWPALTKRTLFCVDGNPALACPNPCCWWPSPT